MNQIRLPETIEEQARVGNYRRLSYKNDWEMTVPLSVMTVFQTAAALARVEGNIAHALSLEARLLELTPNLRYRIGRSRHGCQTACVD